MKKELFEKLQALDILTEEEQNELREDIQDTWVADMYGQPSPKVPKEKNINRVVAGLRAHMGNSNGPHGPQETGASDRYVRALEAQIQSLARQVKQLHSQYNRLTKSHNSALDRINNLASKLPTDR